MHRSFMDDLEELAKQILRWDLLAGAAALGLGLAATGQAVAGQRADEWTFSGYAIVLLAAAAVLLTRAARHVTPITLTVVVALYATGGLETWSLRWWARWGIWLAVVIAFSFLGPRIHTASHGTSGPWAEAGAAANR